MRFFHRALLRRGVPRLSALLLVAPHFLSFMPRDASAAGRPFRNSARSRGRSVVRYSYCQNCRLPFPPRVELCKTRIANLFLRGSPLYQTLVGMANVQLRLYKLFDLCPTGSTAGHLTSRDARGIRVTVRHSNIANGARKYLTWPDRRQRSQRDFCSCSRKCSCIRRTARPESDALERPCEIRYLVVRIG